MFRKQSTRFSVLTLILALFIAGSAFGDAIDEQRQKSMARTATAASGTTRHEDSVIVTAAPSGITAEESALVEELKTARRTGDRVRVNEIISLLGGNQQLPAQAATAEYPDVMALTADPKGGSGSKYAGDVLVLDTDNVEADPDLVSTASGDFYVVLESDNSSDVQVYRSTDGGENWHGFFSIYSTVYDITDPSITIPEFAEDFMYVAYEFNGRIQVLKVELATKDYWFYTVYTNTLGVGRPRITTDNNDYSDYFLYVTFVSGTLLKAGSDCDEVMVACSLDKAATWVDFESLHLPDFSDPTPRPDIAYANDRVFVTWDAEKIGSTTEMDVFVSRSTNFGASWEAGVNLTTGTYYDCFDPRVAGINDSNEVVVVYTKDWVTDTDVGYGFSTDGGDSWDTNHIMAGYVDENEERPDICVSPTLGDFHAVYWHEYDVRHKHASMSDPGSWGTSVIVNDTNEASRIFYPPTVAVQFGTGEAGVAWSDFRTADYGIFFDRADRSPFTGPVCDIKCNGADLPVLVHNSEDVTVRISLEPNDLDGAMGDWWVYCVRNSTGTFWGRYISGSRPNWTYSATPVRFVGVTLRTVNDYTVLGPRTLPIGYYEFTFAVDQPNGIFEGTYADTGSVTVW